MKYGIIKVKRAFLYEENGVDVVDEVFFGWSVMWEDEGEWIEVWTHYGYRGWMERNLIEEKSREWMEEREKAGNTYVVTRGFADVMRGARVQARMLETLGRGCFVEKMEETENGYCRVKLANGISGFVPEVALRKRLDSDRFLWGKSEERFFVEQGIPEGWSEEKFRRKVVECAKGYLGCQYRWGGKAADGIDCSGVVFMVYLMNGVLIWRDADIREGYPMKAIWREGEEMCLVEERAKAGDLLFWRGHVGMYLGDGRYLHCTGHERVFGCRVNSLRRGDEDFREDLAEALKGVKIGENGVTEKDILVHDAHCMDNTLQLKLALMEGPDFPVALGVIRDVEAPTYDDAVNAQIEEVAAKKKYHNFQELLMTNDIWEVK